MKLLADENVDRPIVNWLKSQGHDVLEIARHAPGAEDEQVIDISRSHGRVLLTFDRDIGHLLSLDNRPHPGVIYLRLRGTADQVWHRFEELWPRLIQLVPNHLVTVQNNRLRCRALPMIR